MTASRSKLLQLLTFVQNAPEHAGRDILTFTAFMESDEEVAAHLKANAARMSVARQKALVEKARHMNAEG